MNSSVHVADVSGAFSSSRDGLKAPVTLSLDTLLHGSNFLSVDSLGLDTGVTGSLSSGMHVETSTSSQSSSLPQQSQSFPPSPLNFAVNPREPRAGERLSGNAA